MLSREAAARQKGFSKTKHRALELEARLDVGTCHRFGQLSKIKASFYCLLIGLDKADNSKSEETTVGLELFNHPG